MVKELIAIAKMIIKSLPSKNVWIFYEKIAF